MTSIVSPSEALGLAGAALDNRVLRAAHHVSDRTFARIARRLHEDALANELVYERDGKFEAIPIKLRPLLAMKEQLAYVHHVCLQLTETLKRLPGLYLSNPAVRRILAITQGEDEWLRTHWTALHQRLNPVYGRLDAVCDFAASAWQDSLHFMEANLSGVGGISYSPLCEQLVMRDIVPTLVSHDPDLEIELPRDQRDLFLQALIDHSRALGRPQCRLAFVEPKYAEDGINEQAVLAKLLAERHGLTIVHADPAELYVKNGAVFYEDQEIDVAYRDYETRDLIELEAEEGKKLGAMRLLFRENRIVSSMTGDFDHKSCWEVLTDPEIAGAHFSAEECRMFRRHVLWTRTIRATNTALPHNVTGDLPEFVRTHREELVMKPNRAYGGEGVTIGAATSQADWDRVINEALANENDPDLSWVVQRATRLPVADFPVAGDKGRVFHEPYYVVMGFAPTDNGLGIMCRVSQKQVVNVAQHGGMAAVLVSSAPSGLKAPKRSRERPDGNLAALRGKIAQLQNLDHAIAVLEWDEETALPDEGRDERGAQRAALETLRHALLTSDAMGDLIEDAAAEVPEGDANLARELELLRDLRNGEMSLPEDLVRDFAQACSASQGAWEEAREAGDAAILVGPLSETVRLARELAKAADPDTHPYNVMMEEYEPGLTRHRLEPLREQIIARLAPAVREAAARNERDRPADIFAGRSFPVPAQWDLARDLLNHIGFDFTRGRLDKATHPGTSALGHDDIRMSIRASQHDPSRTMLLTLHEGGHALYDQGYAVADRGTLLAGAPGMALHEGLARLYENHIGRSLAFWNFAFPLMEKHFGASMRGLSPEMIHAHVNRVRPSLIRSHADEVSYHLHIALRVELETALMTGALEVKDLEGLFAERMNAYLGLMPENPRDGVLQDGHWPSGMFGYFPTYTVGSIFAAQLAETYAKQANLDGEVAGGNFGGILTFLRKNVHEVGDRMTSGEIMEKVTGSALDSGAFLRHLSARKLI